MKKSLILTAIAATLLTGCKNERATSGASSGHQSWETRLNEELPVYGHRNWIVIADSAYPRQSNPAIETISTGESQTKVLASVLEAIDKAPHVQAVVMTDAELANVTEADAPGIDAYRAELKTLLNGKTASTEPHEDIIRKLDEDAKLFNVLLLKTDMTIPYTSVFIRLDCGYWNAEKEAKLRDSLK